MQSPLTPFLGVLILLLVATKVAAIVLVLSGVILPRYKPNNPQTNKLSPFECGAPPLQEGARHRYSVKFYLTAMLFILFDVEVAFMLPWAVQYKTQPSLPTADDRVEVLHGLRTVGPTRHGAVAVHPSNPRRPADRCFQQRSDAARLHVHR